MRKREIFGFAMFALLMSLLVFASGCTTLQRLGITDDHVVAGVKIALSRQGLEGTVTDAQMREVIAIIRAHERLNQIGEEIAEQERIQAKIDELVGKYIRNGQVVDPRTIAPDQTSVHPAHRITVWYGGVNMSGATLDPAYQLTVSPAGRDWSEAPASWRSGHAGPGGGHDAVAVCAMAYQRADGTWVGGKFEWHVRPGRRRSLDNIMSGYNGWLAPPSGTPVWFFAHTADGNRISNAVQSIWP